MAWNQETFYDAIVLVLEYDVAGIGSDLGWIEFRVQILTFRVSNPYSKECLVTPNALEINAENTLVRVLEYMPGDHRTQDHREAQESSRRAGRA